MKKQIFWFDGWWWFEAFLERMKDGFWLWFFFVWFWEFCLFVPFHFSLLGWIISDILGDQYQMLSPHLELHF